MATILRAADLPTDCPIAPIMYDDVAGRIGELLSQARAEAEEITAVAANEAETIRREAAREGCKAALSQVETMIAEQTATAVAALRDAAAELQKAKQAWLAQWETNAVRLASAMAAKIIRRELATQPDITLNLVREALELAAGSPSVRVLLNPEDYQALGGQVRTLVETMSSLGNAEITTDASIGRSGCRVETRFGSIDQQIESQLKRIEEELIG